MALPVVAIVGRPNVGKSSLFNVLAGRRTSIVEPTAGVTRDRVSSICEIDDTYYELVDTGGYGVVDRDDLSEHVERQITYAVGQAHLILFVVDANDGLVALDRETARLLRPQADRVRLIANKVDDPMKVDYVSGEFTKLGYGEPLPVSAVTGTGRHYLTEMVADALVGISDEIPDRPVMKIALVGKRNAGKSTFVNALAGEERVIVSETPGTTRDSIDVRFEKDDRVMVAIDTAGVRKQKSMEDSIEFYAYTRAIHAIERADVVLHLIDATAKVSQVDKKLAREVVEKYKPCVLVVNKWDLAKGRATTDDYGEYLSKVLPELEHVPIAFTSAMSSRNIHSALDVAAELFKASQTRVGTGPLNQVLQEALAANSPRPKRGHRPPRFYYATQVSVQPPTIVLFVNAPHLVTTNYERFLLNRFRESLPFGEIPIRLLYRARRDRASQT